jgi:hypothetical protein
MYSREFVFIQYQLRNAKKVKTGTEKIGDRRDKLKITIRRSEKSEHISKKTKTINTHITINEIVIR